MRFFLDLFFIDDFIQTASFLALAVLLVVGISKFFLSFFAVKILRKAGYHLSSQFSKAGFVLAYTANLYLIVVISIILLGYLLWFYHPLVPILESRATFGDFIKLALLAAFRDLLRPIWDTTPIISEMIGASPRAAKILEFYSSLCALLLIGAPIGLYVSLFVFRPLKYLKLLRPGVFWSMSFSIAAILAIAISTSEQVRHSAEKTAVWLSDYAYSQVETLFYAIALLLAQALGAATLLIVLWLIGGTGLLFFWVHRNNSPFVVGTAQSLLAFLVFALSFHFMGQWLPELAPHIRALSSAALSGAIGSVLVAFKHSDGPPTSAPNS